jgi:hypothetical protein
MTSAGFRKARHLVRAIEGTAALERAAERPRCRLTVFLHVVEALDEVETGELLDDQELVGRFIGAI